MIARYTPQSSRRWIWIGLVLLALGCTSLTDSVRGQAPQAAPATRPAQSSGEAVAALCDGRHSLCWYIKQDDGVSYRNNSGTLDAGKVQVVAVAVLRLFPPVNKERRAGPRIW